MSETAAKELQHEQEAELRKEQDAKVTELSRHVEYISKEKDRASCSTRSGRGSVKHLSDAKAEREGHRGERDRINFKPRRSKSCCKSLRHLVEREANAEANLALLAADNEAKMLAVNQGVKNAISEQASAQYESYSVLTDALDSVAGRIDAISSENGFRLKPMELYIIATAFVVVPLLLVFAWAKSVLDAADLALRASSHRQSLEEMIRERNARRLGGGGPNASVTPLQVTGTLGFELPVFEDFAEDQLGNCLTSTMDEMRSFLVTKTVYGVEWQWIVDSTTEALAARDSVVAQVENAFCDIMRRKLSVANPRVDFAIDQAAADATDSETGLCQFT